MQTGRTIRGLFSGLFFLFLITTSGALLVAGDVSRAQYLELLKKYPHVAQPQGDYRKGEIQIVTDPEEMEAIEKSTARDVGILMQDNYWIWINDACIFPNGKKGVYGRILWVKTLKAASGVAVMPMLPDGKIALNCNFRHATRSWEIELPRGALDEGEDVEAAAKRETKEETGMIVDSLSLLGEMPPDTGITNTIVPIFLAKVVDKQTADLGDSEAIEEILTLSIEEIKKGFLQGHLTCNIRGTQQQVFVRDPFLAYALLMYELKSAQR